MEGVGPISANGPRDTSPGPAPTQSLSRVHTRENPAVVEPRTPRLGNPFPTTRGSRRVILKLGKNPSQSLEGGNRSSPQVSERDNLNPTSLGEHEVPTNKQSTVNEDPQGHLTSITPGEAITEHLLSESTPHLTEIISMGDPTTDIHASIVGRYDEDPFFKRVVSEPGAFKNFEVSNRCIFLKDNNQRVLCIPDIRIGS
jgi:hypothetical protein